ncbi:hypothetical protein [Pseudomonas sp. RIT411]|uniref:hypothetical protein n=1 Tax=Pseudomonas sp. RIT411 TaxID=2202160 RepID=UPI000D39614C|nr:hypothetical protein [Pseudomonas sp. RIT 411]RAU39245.1 hypothetical protein DBY63_012255 [Pseudomonas sp. RIT 411]
MGAGFQCFNDDGVVQIDADWRCQALTRAGGFGASPNLQALSVNGSNPLIFFRSDGRIHLTDRRQSGSTFTFYFYAQQAGGVFYVFDWSDEQTNVGFQVFDGNGALVFDAGQKYLRVAGMETLTANYTGSSSFRSMPGRLLAFLGSGLAFDYYSDQIDINMYDVNRSFSYLTGGNGGYYVNQAVDNYNSSVALDGGSSAMCLIADVTNYPTNR